MKTMNKKTLPLAIIAVMEVIIVALVIALFVMGSISDTTFWTVWIVLGLASVPVIYFVVRGVTAGIKSPQEKAAQEADDLNLDEIRLPRTIKSTLVELLTLVLLIAAWWIAVANHSLHSAPDVFICVTIWAIFLLAEAYFPVSSFIFGKMRNSRQVYISALHKRVLAVVLAATGLIRACASIYTSVMDIVLVAVLVLTYAAFRIVQYKAK